MFQKAEIVGNGIKHWVAAKIKNHLSVCVWAGSRAQDLPVMCTSVSMCGM